MEEIISIPGAVKTFNALRSLGYDVNSSIADLVDNAITAKVKAKNIEIYLGFNASYEIIFSIKDDGLGMESDELQEAMRIGADSIYEKGDLGKFGMGMKTASLSHCNILYVISKRENTELSGYCWNLGHVKEVKTWSLLRLSNDEVNEVLRKGKFPISNCGTMVLWDQLFLLNREYSSITSDKLAQNYLFRTIEKLKLHLRMVFHRFLDESYPNQSVSIKVNNEKLTPWDPFCRNEKETVQLKLKLTDSDVYLKNALEPVLLSAYILPTKEKFSSENAWKDAKGLLSWNDSQGYYIYRANRLIRYGGWHGTKAKDEHDKLARISIDINPELDDFFRITVNKSKVEFPELLFQHLKNVVNPLVIRKAQSQYRREPEKNIVDNKIRKKYQLQEVSQDLLLESEITTKESDSSTAGIVEVVNPSGTWLSNKLNEFLKYGNEDDFEIVSDHIENGQLWKIVCDPYNKFKVIINSSHPFYSLMYRSNVNRQVTEAIDALIFSLAFSELYNKNSLNAHLFDTYKTTISKALEKLVKEKVI